MEETRTQGVTLAVRAPTGAQISCKGWHQEGALRMLMNSLAVAEQPAELLASGGAGKVLEDWQSFSETVAALKQLESNETLFVQSGRPAGIRRTSEKAPRVVMMKANRRSKKAGESTKPQSPLECARPFAASWTYLGPQGVLHTAYEVLAAAKARWAGDLSGKLVVSGGMGGMGGALPLAAAFNGAAFLGIEVATEKITRRIREGYCDYCVNDLDEALRILKIAIRRRQPVSVGLAANCAEIIPQLARRGVLPDVLTDQTGAGDPLNGYIPAGLALEAAADLRQRDPQDYLARSLDSIARHFQGMLELSKMGALTFEFGNNIRAVASDLCGMKEAFDLPGFVDAFREPLLRAGRAPILWGTLSGESADGYKIDEALCKLFPEDESLIRWIQLARKYARFQGLPARGAWMNGEERDVFAARINQMVGAGELIAPVVLVTNDRGSGPGWFVPGGVEAPKEAATTKEPALDTLMNAFASASWVAFRPEDEAGEAPTCAFVMDGTSKASTRFLAA